MDDLTFEGELRALRSRADDAFLDPAHEHVAGSHQVLIPMLELKVSVTRARYPNRPTGTDSYAVTLSRIGLDHRPGDDETHAVLAAMFGKNADDATERPSGLLIRTYRIPADAVQP